MTVVCVGEVVLDWLALEQGSSFQDARTFYRCLGGNASNLAIGLSRLGTCSRLLGKVGDDLHGAYLRQVLAGEGVDLRFLLSDERPTAQCYVLTQDDGDHLFYNWPRPHAADMLEAGDIACEALHGASFLHATGISLTLDPRRQAVLAAIDLAAKKGVPVSFDAGYPTGQGPEVKRSAESVMARADVIKFNERELEFWSGSGASLEEMAREQFRRYEPAVLAVTLGARGSLLVSRAGAFFCAPFAVASVNALGAGDAFMAGALHELLSRCRGDAVRSHLEALTGEDWIAVGRAGNAAGALATTRLGASEGLPTAAALAGLIG